MAVGTLRQLLLPFFMYMATADASAPLSTEGGMVLSERRSLVEAGPPASMLDTAFFTLNPVFTQPNAVFSPHSILTVLKAAASGATGECAEDLLSFLYERKAASSLGELPALKALRGAPQAEESSFVLKTLSQVMVDHVYGEREAFKKFQESMATAYPNTDVKTADFHNPEVTARELNAMVEEFTQQKIKNLVRPDNLAHHRLFLLNAIYFKASWLSPFPSEDTSAGEFYSYTKNGLAPSRAMFMRQTLTGSDFVYSKQQIGGQSVTVVGLPYVDRETYMFFYMPEDISEFDRALRRNAKILTALVEKAVSQNNNEVALSVHIPKFHFPADTQVSGWSLLSSLGLQSCMRVGTGAFELIGGDDSLYISGMQHTAYVDVDETGTEAAAATAATFIDGARPMPEGNHVQLDHPFIFQLISRNAAAQNDKHVCKCRRPPADWKKDNILFTGRVASL